MSTYQEQMQAATDNFRSHVEYAQSCEAEAAEAAAVLADMPTHDAARSAAVARYRDRRSLAVTAWARAAEEHGNHDRAAAAAGVPLLADRLAALEADAETVVAAEVGNANG